MFFLSLLAPFFAVLMLGFGLALYYKNNGIADVFWGLYFLVLTLTAYLLFSVDSAQQILLLGMVILWALRLMLHIGRRNWAKPEDPRYAAMRASWGKHPVLGTFFQVFLLQGFLAMVILSPVLWVMWTGDPASLSILHVLGAFLWLFALAFESLSDAQLARFVKTKKPGEIMTRGLWRYSRHPNYFGEVLSWWAVFIVCLSAPGAAWFFVGPLTITGLILFVSGIPLLEKRYEGNPAFEAYKRETSIFVPWFPHKGRH